MALSELQQVNAIIGLSKNIPGWPNTLSVLKYTLARIELKISVPDPLRAGESKIVNPDLLFVSDERNLSLMVELKSGRYQHHDLEQSQNMCDVTPAQLIRGGRVTLAYAGNLNSHKISSVLVVNEEHAGEFVDALEGTACPVCLVSIGWSDIQRRRGELSDPHLKRELDRGISIKKAYLPNRLIRVLPTTNETKDLKRCVVEAVRELWINSRRVVNSDVVAQSLFSNGIWHLFDIDAQKQFVNVANRVLKDMHETEFHRYLQRVQDSNDWNLLRVPDSEGKNRLKAIQTFGKAVRDYKERLLHDVNYPDRRKEQMSFFRD